MRGRFLAAALLLLMAAAPAAPATPAGAAPLDPALVLPKTEITVASISATGSPDGAAAEIPLPLALPAEVSPLAVTADLSTLGLLDSTQAGPVAEPASEATGAAPDWPPAATAAVAGAAAGFGFSLGWLALLGGLRLPWGLFSRIHSDEVLSHPARARMLEVITAEPGLSLQDIRARTGVAWGTTLHHLRRLERGGLVVTIRAGIHRLCFPANTEAARLRTGLAGVRHPTTRSVAALVCDLPGLDQGAVCLELGLRNPNASKHLGRLVAAGLVEAHRDGRRTRYAPTSLLKSVLQLAVANPTNGSSSGAFVPRLLQASPSGTTALVAV